MEGAFLSPYPGDYIFVVLYPTAGADGWLFLAHFRKPFFPYPFVNFFTFSTF
jgi:hypothetical protein